MDFVINQKLSKIEGRKAVVLFTDGVDTASHHATYQDNIRDAEELDALIYPVQYNTYTDVGGYGGGSGPSSWPSGRRGGGGGGGILIDILGGILGGGSNRGSGGVWRRGGGGSSGGT